MNIFINIHKNIHFSGKADKFTKKTCKKGVYMINYL